MERKLLIGSNNIKKIIEIKQILGHFFTEFLTFKDLGLDSPEENGSTFKENSLIKARYGLNKTNITTLADDSGLCVPALDGEPGIYSSRYYQEGDDINNYLKLLDKMKNIPSEHRNAYFVSTIALVFPDGKEMVTEGRLYGTISKNPKGTRGFGYDPVFYLKDFDKTLAQITSQEKNSISHRAKALKEMERQLGGIFS